MRGPKVKYDKDLIVEKSREYIDKNGIKQISIRNLAKYIGCSTQPIFRQYKNSEELLKDVYISMEKYYENFVERISSNIDIPFLGLGLSYINFSKEHPNLFFALFMNDLYKKDNLLDFFKNEESDSVIKDISKQTELSSENCRKLLRNIWLLTHGMATMIYTKQVKYNDKEIREILFHGFYGFISILKQKERKND
ncbi:TetR/AcrR family transcriptional regulator [Miniphocaeibacter massiliensis]|uniref:TetR/AcrR family transcriptional regulator n=1 Tax=Miniphocaeibacter massiliensis TaxID=2041841 RepID=UPI000C07EF1F|nr:TetR/AcrR family transcriptional regulator [Miniphocaeibacter massiliensis]